MLLKELEDVQRRSDLHQLEEMHAFKQKPQASQNPHVNVRTQQIHSPSAPGLSLPSYATATNTCLADISPKITKSSVAATVLLPSANKATSGMELPQPTYRTPFDLLFHGGDAPVGNTEHVLTHCTGSPVAIILELTRRVQTW